MRRRQYCALVSALCALAWVGCGCASYDTNPKKPHPGRGYVDLYLVPKADVWWKVDVYHTREQRYKPFTAQFDAPGEGVFRVEARPGFYRARIRFVNQAVLAPAEVEVEVREGQVTPIRVLAQKVGSAFVRKVEDRLNPYTKNEVTDLPQRLWEISAAVEPPAPYAAKAAMHYWK